MPIRQILAVSSVLGPWGFKKLPFSTSSRPDWATQSQEKKNTGAGLQLSDRPCVGYKGPGFNLQYQKKRIYIIEYLPTKPEHFGQA